MKYKHSLIVLAIIISAFFCADVIAVILKAKLTILPAVSWREYQPALGVGEAGRAFNDYQVIPRRNLFGLKDPTPPPPPKPVSLPPKPVVTPRPVNNVPPPRPQPVTLNLKLKGTISGNPGWERAVLEDAQKSEEVLLKVGNRIQGAELIEIKAGEVIFSQQGQRISLRITSENEAPPPAYQPTRPTYRPPEPSPIELNQPEIPPQSQSEEDKPAEETELDKLGFGERVDETSWKIDRQAVINKISNLDDLVNQVSVLPYMEGGNIQGFRVSNIAPGSIFENLGAQEGDIIEEVNGVRLTNVNQVMSLYSELQMAPEIRVRVKRGQGYQFLVYNLQ